ncbi:peptidoglycan-binding protein [Kitasatospora aburaviensis]
MGYPLPETGFYGPQTTAAVNAFIRLNPSLAPADGVAGRRPAPASPAPQPPSPPSPSSSSRACAARP